MNGSVRRAAWGLVGRLAARLDGGYLRQLETHGFAFSTTSWRVVLWLNGDPVWLPILARLVLRRAVRRARIETATDWVVLGPPAKT